MEQQLSCAACRRAALESLQMAPCAEGHVFCKPCIKRSAEQMLEDGVARFPCLDGSCGAQFSDSILQELLSPKMFASMTRYRLVEELETAHIEGLVRCPHCEYAAILPPGIHIFNCENPECPGEPLSTAALKRKRSTGNDAADCQIAWKRVKLMEARLECQICCEDDLEIEQMAACAEGHLFCKNCVKKSAETRIGDGLTKFPCLEDTCSAEFGTRTLEELLSPDLFARLSKQRAVEDVDAAQIDGLVRCGFCEFAAVLPPDVHELQCRNPECLRNTCRHCAQSSHHPRPCSDNEKEPETAVRTHIENKMAEAMIRKCNKCGKKFVKSEGCNKMVCPCGAMMCYVCRQTVTDYTHFNGQGGSQHSLLLASVVCRCPLFCSEESLHREEVKMAAYRARQELLERTPGVALTIDFTSLLP